MGFFFLVFLFLLYFNCSFRGVFFNINKNISMYLFNLAFLFFLYFFSPCLLVSLLSLHHSSLSLLWSCFLFGVLVSVVV